MTSVLVTDLPDPPIKAPGRGAWTREGGLLPIKPGSTKKGWYYRQAGATEVLVGRAGSRRKATYSERAVHLAVKAIQIRLGVAPDGLWGSMTDGACRSFQQGARLAVDGVFGPASALALLAPEISETALAHGVPSAVLGGIARLESGLDPAAVGLANGADTGTCQINRLTFPDTSMASAIDPHYALNWSAAGLRKIADRWSGKTSVDIWTIAIASHNSPAAAQEWALTGKAPFSQFRHDNGFPQINEYVASVRKAGEVFA